MPPARLRRSWITLPRVLHVAELRHGLRRYETWAGSHHLVVEPLRAFAAARGPSKGDSPFGTSMRQRYIAEDRRLTSFEAARRRFRGPGRTCAAVLGAARLACSRSSTLPFVSRSNSLQTPESRFLSEPPGYHGDGAAGGAPGPLGGGRVFSTEEGAVSELPPRRRCHSTAAASGVGQSRTRFGNPVL